VLLRRVRRERMTKEIGNQNEDDYFGLQIRDSRNPDHLITANHRVEHITVDTESTSFAGRMMLSFEGKGDKACIWISQPVVKELLIALAEALLAEWK
jgi:hypothetical protein